MNYANDTIHDHCPSHHNGISESDILIETRSRLHTHAFINDDRLPRPVLVLLALLLSRERAGLITLTQLARLCGLKAYPVLWMLELLENEGYLAAEWLAERCIVLRLMERPAATADIVLLKSATSIHEIRGE